MVSVAVKSGQEVQTARSREASASKPSMKCRKRIRRCQNRGVTLVWGFFCQGVRQCNACFCPSSVSLFDLKARFFVSDRKPSRAGAVKAGRLFGGHPQGLALTVPSTAAPSNAVGLGQQDDDQRGARIRARIYRATTLYSVGPRTRTMMQSCASVRSSEAADPFSVTA